MKIAIASPLVPDSFSDNVRHTLRAMGHEVLTPSMQTWAEYYGLGARIRRRLPRRVAAIVGDSVDRWLKGVARDLKPDLVLALTHVVSAEVLAEVRSRGVPRCIAWWGDAIGNMPDPGLLAKGWDIVYLKDAEAVRKFGIAGFETRLLHEAMNPAWHKPFPGPLHDGVVVVGNAYGYRQALLARLMNDGVEMHLYGPRPARDGWPEAKRAYRGRFVVKQDKSRVFAEGLACLNSTHFREGNALNCRAFEVAGAGGLQIMEYRPAVEECFDPGEEILVYSEYSELTGHIAWARGNPEGAARVRRAGARRARESHTYEIRLARILKEAFA